MLKKAIDGGGRGRIVLVDTITKVGPEDAGARVVAASHGGSSSAEFALAVPLAAVFFNDAGVGKDEAGIAALAFLQQRGIAAGAVSHTSARIGDAADMWENGVISYVNAAAAALGYSPGGKLQDALLR